MKWKALLTALVILGLAAALVFTVSGRSLIGKLNLDNFMSSFSSLFNPKPQGEYFTMLLSADKESFYGQLYRVTNSSLLSNGICQGFIVLSNDVNVDKNLKRCSINLNNINGEFEYTSVGSERGVFDVSAALIDDTPYSSTDTLKVSFETVPANFLLTGLSERKIIFTVINGEFTRFKEDGSVDLIKNFKNENIEIINFIGNIRLEDNSVYLNGFATKVNW